MKKFSFEQAFDYALLRVFGIKTFNRELKEIDRKLKKKPKEKPFHWYSIKMVYKDKNMNVLFDFVTYIGYANQADVFEFKLAKKYFFKEVKATPQAKKLLCNGVVTVEVIGYLGFFAKNEK